MNFIDNHGESKNFSQKQQEALEFKISHISLHASQYSALVLVMLAHLLQNTTNSMNYEILGGRTAEIRNQSECLVVEHLQLEDPNEI